MKRTCIAVADASRARLFLYDDDGFVERVSLINPARRQRPSELFADSPASSRSGSLRYGLDDHRDAHVAEIDDRFARDTADEIDRLVHASHASRLVVCASPHMLGHLRAHLPRNDVEIDELAHDYVKLTPPELRAHLARHGLVPAATRTA